MRPYLRELVDLSVGVKPADLSPLEELLLMHPVPWTAHVPSGGNQAQAVVCDALGYTVHVAGWGQALAAAVNIAGDPKQGLGARD
jgi:hypothetical protein